MTPAVTGWTLVGRSLLEGAELEAVVRLQRRCERAQGLDLKLTLGRSVAAPVETDLLAVSGGEVVGYCGLDRGGEVEVCGMVDPAHRGRGIGTALLERATVTAGRLGHAGVLVICEQAAPEAIDWLRRHGGRLEHTEHRMVLRLAAARLDGVGAPPPTVLREARPQDRGFLRRLLAEGFDQTPEQVEARLDPPEQPGGERTLVAWSGDQPVGTTRLVGAPGRSMIYGFVVDPARRGQGCGAAMLRAALELLRDQGVAEVSLEVDPDNQPAVRLYRRVGFEVVTVYRYVRIGAFGG